MNWISFREGILNSLLSIHRTSTINNMPCKGLEGMGVPEAMNKCILDIKKNAVIGMNGVEYGRLSRMATFQEFCMASAPCLRDFNPSALPNRESQLAFWINVYNLMVLDAVIRFKIQNSVTEGWLGVLRFFRRAAYTIHGMRFSLEDIEHGILRANQGFPFIPGSHFSEVDPRKNHVITPFDPRIHFALNCASQSCPPIAFYEVDKLDGQLDEAVKNFVNADTLMNEKRNMLFISSIYKWYKNDFGGEEGILGWIRRYLPEGDERSTAISWKSNSLKIKYKPYDWSLNRII